MITNTPGAFNPSWSHDSKWVYFVGWQQRCRGRKNYFDFSTRKVRPIFKISGGGAFPGLSVSPDGRYILYPELDDYRSDIMLVENFH